MPRGDADQRTAYIGKELDQESELGDHGVRKVDYELGRFTTIDPLWEKYYAWSPYQYSMNNPISLADYNGKDFGFVVDPADAGGNGHTTLYFQSGDGQWYSFDQGADASNSWLASITPGSSADDYGRPSCASFMFLSGLNSQARVYTRPVKEPAPGTVFFQTTSEQDEKIFESAFEKKKSHNEGGDSYNLYSNNCTDSSVDVIHDSGTGIKIENAFFTIKPNTWFFELKKSIQDGTQKTDFRPKKTENVKKGENDEDD